LIALTKSIILAYIYQTKYPAMSSNTPISSHKIAAAIIALLAWSSLILQFYLKTGSAVNFFSFFTVECNLLVAVTLSFSFVMGGTAAARFFTSSAVRAGIAVYIFIVALVYNTVLRGLVSLESWGLLADTMLHVVIPILYLLFCIFFIPGKTLHWKDGLYWIIFPLCYLIYSLARGAATHWYPYPFLNADVHGYGKVFINVGVMILVFFATGLGCIFINRRNRNVVL
jgi:hypothetical protein